MKDFSRHAYRQWYVAALSKDLREGAQPVLLLGSNLALGRLASGDIFALEDRCPHRGVPLSDGRLREGGIACRHHGWTFNAAGYCIGVPGAQAAEQFQDIRVAACTTREHDGLVWVARSPQAPFPDRIYAVGPGQRRDLWQAKAQASSIDLQSYAIDALHAEIMQSGATRAPPVRSAGEALLETSADGFSIDYQLKRRPSSVLLRVLGSGNVGTRISFSGLSVLQLEYRDARDWRAWLTICFTPETLVSTRVYTSLHVEKRSVPTWLARLAMAPFLRALAGHERKLVAGSRQTSIPPPGTSALVPAPSFAGPYLEEAWQGTERHLPAQQDLSAVP